jgi:hypothetical protein
MKGCFSLLTLDDVAKLRLATRLVTFRFRVRASASAGVGGHPALRHLYHTHNTGKHGLTPPRAGAQASGGVMAARQRLAVSTSLCCFCAACCVAGRYGLPRYLAYLNTEYFCRGVILLGTRMGRHVE